MIGFPIQSCKKGESSYPKTLAQIAKVPETLYYIGDIGLLNEKCSVAVIGMRNASKHGMETSYQIGRLVAEKAMITVNGLAIGCDTAALQGALAEDGKCVAVMPCGLDRLYPRSNQKLAERILEKGGCLISEYEVGITPQKAYFVERDRLQSGISRGVIVVEAEENGGTIHTAKFALRQYRRLACYYSALLEHPSGNISILNAGKGERLESMEAVRNFLDEILNEETYEQLSFF